MGRAAIAVAGLAVAVAVFLVAHERDSAAPAPPVHDPIPTGATRQAGSQASLWRPRGNQRDDRALRSEITRVVGAWRTPDGVAPELDGASALWVGEIDGTTLAVVQLRPRGID